MEKDTFFIAMVSFVLALLASGLGWLAVHTISTYDITVRLDAHQSWQDARIEAIERRIEKRLDTLLSERPAPP